MAEDEYQNTDDSGDVPVLSEQEWDEFERSFTKESTKTATFREPSARQRELSQKWRRAHPRDTGWRTDGTPSDLDAVPLPEHEREPAAPLGYGAERRRRWRRNVAWVILAALITSAIIGVPRLFSSSKGDTDRNPNVPPSGSGGAASKSAAGDERGPVRFSVQGRDYQMVMVAPGRGRTA